MAITRTIYTQGKLTIDSGATTDWAVLSGVQNATYSINTPRENVNQFSAKGLIDKVQVAPTEATITCSFIIPTKGQAAGSHITAAQLNGLIQMGSLTSDLPNMTVTAGGLGKITGAILSSININAAAGELPTMELTFQGIPPSNPIDTDTEIDGTKVSNPPIAETYSVTTPDIISGFADGAPFNFTLGDDSSDAIRTATFAYDMPVERIQRLGESVDLATPFGNPPGTASLTFEGTNVAKLTGSAGGNVSGLVIGPYQFIIGGRLDIVSREHSMAVGDIAASYSVNYEGTADAVICSAS
ncbi:MAG: hypothetical protein ACO25L_02845 [Candidatus Nanopelagicales bacterium]